MKPITHYWQNLNPLSLLLMPLSLLFCLLVKIRRFAYSKHWLTAAHFNLPVIVVGNIYIGGNGKTPFVIWLAEALKRHGFNPAIVSRGYGASRQGSWPREVILKDDLTPFGDEPSLIKKRTGCPVFIDPKRSRAIKKIQQTYTRCDVIISDDGLQHYAMSRDIEINITDTKRQYGNRLCLPAGPLREPVSRLQTVDFIIYNQAGHAPNQKSLKQNEFLMSYDFDLLHSLDGKQSARLSEFNGRPVHAVAGIGDPERFFSLLSHQGLDVIKHPYADHYAYAAKDLVFFDTYPVIMTEKDAIKCIRLNLDNCWYLPISAHLKGPLSESIINLLRQDHG